MSEIKPLLRPKMPELDSVRGVASRSMGDIRRAVLAEHSFLALCTVLGIVQFRGSRHAMNSGGESYLDIAPVQTTTLIFSPIRAEYCGEVVIMPVFLINRTQKELKRGFSR